MKKILSLAKIFLGWPISLLALFFVIKIISAQSTNISSQIKQVDKMLLLYAALCFLAYYFLRCYLWKKILASKGYHFSLKSASFLWGWAEVKRFIPGNIWSQISKTLLFAKENVPHTTVISAIVIETQLIIVGSALLPLFAIPYIFRNIFIARLYTNALTWVLILGIAIIIFYIFQISKFKKFTSKNKIFRYLLIAYNFFLPTVSFTTKLSFIFVACIAFFFFGLGTYLTIASIYPLNPYFIFELIGYFVFSYLVGYVSLVAPMGLGVREGVIMVGLSKLMQSPQAVFAAVFARIVLIISELVFLFIAFLWKKIEYGRVILLERYIARHALETALLLLIIIYNLYFITSSFLRYDNFYTGRFDLGNMDQTVWNTYHGRIFQLTDPNGTEIISRVSFHADYFLLLLSPLYSIWQSPKMLLLIQSIVVSLGALFIYLLGNEIIKNKKIALILSIAFLLNPSLEHSNLYDFHAVTLSTTFILAAFYFVYKNKFLPFLLFGVLAALTKEQVWLIFGLFGVYIAVVKSIRFRNKKLVVLGLFISLISVFIFYELFWKIIPAARGGSHFALSYYSDFGASPVNIVKNALLSPQKTLNLFMQNGRPLYMLQLFLPVGFLPLLSPLFIVFIIPDLFINLLSNNSQLHQIYYQYTATITPFLFIAAIFGIQNIRGFLKIPTLYCGLFVLGFAISGAYLYGPLPGAQNPNLDMIIKPQANKPVINHFLKTIPRKASVAATNNLGAHLSHRQNIYTIPIGMEKADFIAFLLGDKFAQPSPYAQQQMIESLKKNSGYEMLINQGDFTVFRKKQLSS